MRVLASLFVLTLAACSEAPSVVPASTVAAQSSERAPTATRATRHQSAELTALRRAIEFGDVERARTFLTAADAAGPEGTLLRARLANLEGRGVEAMRVLESAKTARPLDPDVYATAAEIYVAREAFDTAWTEITNGTKACGPAPELDRARGLAWISRENGAERGLAVLLAARAADPSLPFVDRALGQAHLLVAKGFAKAEKLPEALASARASLANDPTDVDARRFLGDCLAASGEYGEALVGLRALIADGQPFESELALLEKRAGFARLLAGDKAGAIDHFLSARAAGLSDEELSSAAEILAEAATARTDAGVTAFESGDLERAEAEFRAALDLWPDEIAARNHLALVRFRRDDPAEAARLWRGVLELAAREKLELPEPVHVNLAQAELRRGESAAARKVLDDYMRASPQGEWVGVTRTLLAQIDASAKR